jgi:hypothetical protein
MPRFQAARGDNLSHESLFLYLYAMTSSELLAFFSVVFSPSKINDLFTSGRLLCDDPIIAYVFCGQGDHPSMLVSRLPVCCIYVSSS